MDLGTLNKQSLEEKFAEDFSSPFFPVLANIYFDEGDIRRARLVCDVGLKHDPQNTDGKFISALIAKSEKNLRLSEQLLKQVVIENPAHFKGLRMLISIEVELNRSPKTIEKYINRLAQFLPDDQDCVEWRKKLNLNKNNSSKQLHKTVRVAPKKNTPKIKQKSIQSQPKYRVDASMATFTMVNVLRSQKEFHQALSVLDVLQSMNKDSKKIESLKQEIMHEVSSLK